MSLMAVAIAQKHGRKYFIRGKFIVQQSCIQSNIPLQI